MNNGSKKHIGHQIVAMMDRLGVAPLTRNYHLFYMCLSNADENIRVALRALGNSPKQAEIDHLIEQFTPEAIGSGHMLRQQDDMLKNLDGVLSKLNTNQQEVANFTGAVDRMSETLADQSNAGKVRPEVLFKVAQALVDAGRRKVAAGNKTLTQVGSHVDELSKLRDEIERLQALANTDELTQLANRRSFDETLASLYTQDNRSSFALVMLDIDHFKLINDTHGHATGDQVLVVIAECLKTTTRLDSFLARIGGEEFAVIMRDANEEEVKNAAERIRAAVEGLDIVTRAVRLTVSVGACMADMASTPQGLYEKTDAALYRSKKDGRNRVTMDGVAYASTERYRMYKR